jgi:hypothetical protein
VIDRLDGVHSITVKDFDELDRLEELGGQFDSTLIIYSVINVSNYQSCASRTNLNSHNPRQCRMAHGFGKGLYQGSLCSTMKLAECGRSLRFEVLEIWNISLHMPMTCLEHCEFAYLNIVTSLP